MKKTVEKREFAVIGLGRFGSSLALELASRGHHVMGIDCNPALVQTYAGELTHIAALDASDEDALRAVDIVSFDTVVVAIGANFEANLMATVALKAMGVKRVICKALTRRQAMILERVGADRVVLPEEEAGRRLALQLAAPNLMEMIPLEAGYSIAEVPMPNSLDGQQLGRADLKERYGLTVLVVRRGHETIISPADRLTLIAGDLLVLVGSDEGIARFSNGH